MSKISYSIFLVGVALEICLVWRLLQNRLWRLYSCLFSYVLYEVIIMTFALFGILSIAPDLYRKLYWKSETVSITLKFLVVWEVFRHTLPTGSTLKRIVSKGFATAAFGSLIFSVCMFWSFMSSAQFHYVYPVLERSFGLAQAVLILAVLLMARYYGLPLGRNIWGIAVGLGAYVSISIVIFAVLDMTNLFVPYMQVLSPLSFVGMLGVWTWALWTYAPNPPIPADEHAEQDTGLDWWSEGWDRAVSTVRKLMHS